MSELSWTEALHALEGEGYRYTIIRGSHSLREAFAWPAHRGHYDGVVHSYDDNPTKALNDLLAKCREKWAPPSPFASMDLEAMFDAAHGLGWSLHVDWAQDQRLGKWFADAYERRHGHEKGHGETPRLAALAALTALERAVRK